MEDDVHDESIGLGMNAVGNDDSWNQGGTVEAINTLEGIQPIGKRTNDGNVLDPNQMFKHMSQCMSLVKEISRNRDSLPIEFGKQMAEIFASHLSELNPAKRAKPNEVVLEEEEIELVEKSGISFSDNQHDKIGKNLAMF